MARLSVFMEREEMEENEEPLLRLSLKSYSSNSREEKEREKSSQRRRTEHREKVMRQQLGEWRENLALMEETSRVLRAGEHQCSPGLTGRTGRDALNQPPHLKKEGDHPANSDGRECVSSCSETQRSAHSSPCSPGGWIWSWWLWCCLDSWSRGSAGSDPTQTSSRYHPELPSSLKNKTPHHFLWSASNADGEANISDDYRKNFQFSSFSPTCGELLCSNHWGLNPCFSWK